MALNEKEVASAFERIAKGESQHGRPRLVQ